MKPGASTRTVYVDAHQGTIGVETGPGGGTTVTVHLPLRSVTPAAI